MARRPRFVIRPGPWIVKTAADFSAFDFRTRFAMSVLQGFRQEKKFPNQKRGNRGGRRAVHHSDPDFPPGGPSASPRLIATPPGGAGATEPGRGCWDTRGLASIPLCYQW